MPVAEARPMLHRRSSATAIALLVLLSGALTACGFDNPTDRVNTIAAGANNRDANVDVLGVRVLSSAAGEGRLIGSLANNTNDDAALRAVSGGEGVSVDGPAEDIIVPARGRVNLAAADTTPIFLAGDFKAGQVIELSITVVSDVEETVTLDVPVVKNCGQYTQVPQPEAPGDAESAEHAEDQPAGDEHAEDGHTGDATYLCEHPTPGTEH